MMFLNGSRARYDLRVMYRTSDKSVRVLSIKG